MSRDENSRPARQMLSSLLPDSQQSSLLECGFKIVRKRRNTVQDVKSLSPSSKTPRRRRSSGFARPDNPASLPRRPSDDLSEQDYVLQEDNLVSQPGDVQSYQQLGVRPVLGTCSLLPGNERRPSAIKNSRQRTEMESPVSFRTKRCASLCLATRRQSRGLRERNRSVNGYNIPKMNSTQLNDVDLAGKLQPTLKTTQAGKHADLKYIDDETLARLLPGEHLTKQPIIIDARYPYEFRGGHIKGAINLYTPQMLIEYLYGMDKENGGGGGVIIFHCEFSSERAPALLRCLRRVDRSRNCYPKLDFPELYLLKDGYKNFFENQLSATTGTYLPMLDGKHSNDLKHFRKKCKTAPSDKI